MPSQTPILPPDQATSIFQEGRLVCIDCFRKHNYPIPSPCLWHFATCIMCRMKGTVTKQANRK